jgi:hypothetical protein
MPNSDIITPEPAMSIQYRFALDELVKLAPDWSRFAVGWPSKLYWWGLLPLIFLMVSAGASMKLAVVIMLLLTLCGPLIGLYQSKLTNEAIYTEDHCQLSLMPTTATIDQTGFHLRCEAWEITYQWRYIRHTIRTDKYIHVCLDQIQFHTIPVRAFASAEEVSRFCDTVRKFSTEARTQQPT